MVQRNKAAVKSAGNYFEKEQHQAKNLHEVSRKEVRMNKNKGQFHFFYHSIAGPTRGAKMRTSKKSFSQGYQD